MKLTMFLKEFCHANTKTDLVTSNRRTKNHVMIEVRDNRNRIRQIIRLSRNALPKGTKPGDRLEIKNLTQETVNKIFEER